MRTVSIDGLSEIKTTPVSCYGGCSFDSNFCLLALDRGVLVIVGTFAQLIA